MRKAMRRLQAPWLPCMAHSMHNAVHTALGISGTASLDDSDALPSPESTSSRNPATKLLLSRTRKLWGHLNHSDLSISIYRGLDVQGETEAREVITEVPTRWSSFYRALARLYTCYLRMCAFLDAEGVSASARKRRLSSTDWDRIRQRLGVLKGAMEVTMRSESATDPICVSFAAVCSYRRAMFSDCFVVPCPPGPPLAAGKRDMDAYCTAHPRDLLVELDDRLYRAKLLYFEERPGRDGLCAEAEQVGSILREQLDMRFLAQHNISRNLLKLTPVLMSTALSPGGSKLIKAASKMMAVEGMKEQAVLDIRGVCDRILEPATAPLTNATPPAACAPRTRRVYSALPEWTDNEESQGDNGRAESTKATLAKAQLDECMQAIATSKTKDPMEYWKENMARFSSMYPVACAALGVSASSAASKRDFSIAGNVVRKERSALLPRHVEMHTLIKENARFLSKSLHEVPKLTHEAAVKVCSEIPLGRASSAASEQASSSSDESDG